MDLYSERGNNMDNPKFDVKVGDRFTNRAGLEFEVIEKLDRGKNRIRFIETGYTIRASNTSIVKGRPIDRMVQKCPIEVGQIHDNNQDLLYEIISRTGKPDEWNIKFLESGFERTAKAPSIFAGEVLDTSVTRPQVRTGDIFYNNLGYKFEVLERTGSSSFHIKFDSGYEVIYADTRNIIRGSIKDYLSPSVYGVGILGYSEPTINNKMEYKIWSHMLERCYDTKCHHYFMYGEVHVTVCERWLRFDYFLEDLPKLHGYDKKLLDQGKIHLDKDYKQFNLGYGECKVYSPSTCIFLPQKLNCQLSNFVNINIEQGNMYVDGKLMYNLPQDIPAKIHPAKIIPATIIKKE